MADIRFHVALQALRRADAMSMARWAKSRGEGDAAVWAWVADARREHRRMLRLIRRCAEMGV